MKKAVSVILALVLCLSLAACDKENKTENKNTGLSRLDRPEIF